MKLISLIVLLISLVFFYTAPNYPSRPFMGFCTIIAIFLIVLQIKGYCTDKELKKIYLRHSTIFLIFFFIVFFQRATDFSLGIIDQDSISVYDLIWAYVPSVVSKASALALLALSTFLFGYHCYSPRLLKDCIYTYKFRSKYFLVTSGFGLLFVYVALTGIGDFSKHSEDENMGFLMVAQAVLLAIVVIYSYEYKNKVNAKSIRILYFLFPLSLILFYLFVYFATGNRGGAIKVCLMLLASYVYIAKDGVNYKRIFVLFIIGAFSMTLIGIIRMQETKKLNEISSLISAKETISPLTVELSGSVNTVHLVLANVPIKQNYNWGTSFINGFSVLVPGLSRITHGVAEPSGETITKMYFGENMPLSAMKAGADMAAVSMHKSGGSLTQSSLLLTGPNVHAGYVRQIINLTQTTSGSYLLMSSLDISRRNLALRGRQVFHQVADMAEYAREEINAVGGYYAFGKELCNGNSVFDFDTTKLSVHTLDIGLAGIEVYDILRDEYDIQIEFGDIGNILAYLSIGDRPQEVERLVSALAEIKRRYHTDGTGLLSQEYIDPEVAASPQEAFYAPKKSLPLRETEGMVCSEFVMCYPPGIPILAPGERITAEILDYIEYAKAKGCSMTGPEDPDILRLNVLA